METFWGELYGWIQINSSFSPIGAIIARLPSFILLMHMERNCLLCLIYFGPFYGKKGFFHTYELASLREMSHFFLSESEIRLDTFTMTQYLHLGRDLHLCLQEPLPPAHQPGKSASPLSGTAIFGTTLERGPPTMGEKAAIEIWLD